MGRTYLIDGYNLLHALGMNPSSSASTPLKDARSMLLQFLATVFAENASQVTVVFDAARAPRRGNRQHSYQGMEVEFADQGASADDRIEELIQAAEHPGALVVVSNDNRLRKAAQRRGASAWSHEDLLDFAEQSRPSQGQGKHRPKSDRADRDSALELEYWVKEFAALEEDPSLREFFELDRFD